MRVVERTIDKQGQQLLVPALELEGWWTSLAFEATVIIALSADHKIRTRSRGLPRAGCLPVLVEYSYLRFKTRVVDPLGASLLRHSPLESQLPVHLYTNKSSSHLRERTQEVEAGLSQDSPNSSKPPSSDPPFRKPPPRSQRQPSGRQPGGQAGRRGVTRRTLTGTCACGPCCAEIAAGARTPALHPTDGLLRHPLEPSGVDQPAALSANRRAWRVGSV